MEIIEKIIRDTEEKLEDPHRIVLINTNRNFDEYFLSLKYRHSKKYKKIPHYIIKRDGTILQTLSLDNSTTLLSSENLNKTSIIICLENLGWLKKKPLDNEYVNWIGNIYKGESYTKSWRDYFIWQPYTDDQIKSLSELCVKITDEKKINKDCVGTNTKINGITEFNGIICRSNVYSQTTDLTPAFDFDKFINYLENA